MIGEASPLLSPQIMIYSLTLTVSDKFLFLSRVIQPRHLSGHFTPQGHTCNTACVQKFSVFFLLNGLLLWTLVTAYIRSKVYEGVSKRPRTMLITRKSLVVHEFPARVCCGCVLWVSVPSGVFGCGSVWLFNVSLCVYCISRLRFSDIGGMAEVDEQRVFIKFCVRLGKTGSEAFEMLKRLNHFWVVWTFQEWQNFNC